MRFMGVNMMFSIPNLRCHIWFVFKVLQEAYADGKLDNDEYKDSLRPAEEHLEKWPPHEVDRTAIA